MLENRRNGSVAESGAETSGKYLLSKINFKEFYILVIWSQWIWSLQEIQGPLKKTLEILKMKWQEHKMTFGQNLISKIDLKKSEWNFAIKKVETSILHWEMFVFSGFIEIVQLPNQTNSNSHIQAGHYGFCQFLLLNTSVEWFEYEKYSTPFNRRFRR